MPGFLYDPLKSVTLDSFCQFLALGGTARRSKVGTFSLQMATGSQAVTGVGFKPELLFVMGVNLTGAGDSQYAILHAGAAAGGGQWAGGLYDQNNNYSWNATRRSLWRDNKIIACPSLAGIDFEAELTSFDVDGFTLNVTDAPTDWSPFCVYIAIRGAGAYLAGTTLSLAGTGPQIISTPGITPTAIYVMQGPGALGLQDDCRVGSGLADASNQYAVWSGVDKGRPFVTSRYDSGKLITFAKPAIASAGVGREILAQAALTALQSGGFALNWTTSDGVQRPFHWFVVEGPADAGRFLYQPSTNNNVVLTTCTPVALLGQNVEATVEGWASNSSAASGYSVCNSDGNVEWYATWQDRYPSFISITRTHRALGTGSFGTFRNKTNAHQACDVCDVHGIFEDRIVGMNWRYATRHGAASRALQGAS